MARTSAFISGCEHGGVLKKEGRFYAVQGTVLLVGALAFISCAASLTGAALFASGWLLVISSALSLLRPLIYPRGFSDGVSALVCAGLYAFVGFFPGLIGAVPKDSLRLVFILLLFFAGLTRLIAFAGVVEYSALPFQLVCCAADIACALLLLRSGAADESAAFIFPGMALIAGTAESFCESAVLLRRAAKE